MDAGRDAKVLIVDDDFITREALREQVMQLGYQAALAETGEEALVVLKDGGFDAVLLDMVMPGADGYAVLSTLKRDESLQHVPVIMVSGLEDFNSVVRCIEAGAEDYLTKPFDPVLLKARLGACLEKKYLRDQEQAHLALIERTQRRLEQELAEASRYVMSILPAKENGALRTDWRYIPSTELGGDSFGYHWIDAEHFAVYLLDVCGHGVGASLLSVSVINVIRNQSLDGVDFTDPAAVLTKLNAAFPMERQNDQYFTLWYGVYDSRTGALHHASGGHPPAVLIEPAIGEETPQQLHALRCPGPLVGVVDGADYAAETVMVTPGSRLYVFCDGVYELERDDGTVSCLEDFILFLQVHGNCDDSLGRLVEWAQGQNVRDAFDDDFSVVRVDFPV